MLLGPLHIERQHQGFCSHSGLCLARPAEAILPCISQQQLIGCCVSCALSLQDLFGCGWCRLLHCCSQHAHVHRIQHPDTQGQQDSAAVSGNSRQGQLRPCVPTQLSTL
jgi:hypothetical protein